MSDRSSLFEVVIVALIWCGCASTSRLSHAAARPAERPSLAALAGSAWRLVEIVSMDDSVYAPDDRNLYTLTFAGDGSMSLRADCNRGTGSWSSDSPGQLRFGRIAATQALCPPGSLHDRYLAQFEWVRSYIIRDDHLFLATMADGSIIELEPLPNDGASPH